MQDGVSGLRYVELDGKWRLMPEKLKTQAVRYLILGSLKKGSYYYRVLYWGLGFRVQGTLFWGPYNREHGKPLLIKATCVIQEQAYPVEVDKGALSAFHTRAVNRACLGVI